MCQSNDANTVCRLPITRFSGSKDRHRAGIPFCIDTKATILSFLAEHGVTLDILPTGRCSDYTFLAGLRARCFLAQGSDFERVVNERFASLVKSLARRADREGMIANARWCAPAATWKPHDFAVWLRGHCAMKNHWERPPSGVRHMPQAQQQHLPGLQPSSPTSDPQSKLLHMMGGLCLSEPPVDDSVLDELLASPGLDNGDVSAPHSPGTLATPISLRTDHTHGRCRPVVGCTKRTISEPAAQSPWEDWGRGGAPSDDLVGTTAEEENVLVAGRQDWEHVDDHDRGRELGPAWSFCHDETAPGPFAAGPRPRSTRHKQHPTQSSPPPLLSPWTRPRHVLESPVPRTPGSSRPGLSSGLASEYQALDLEMAARSDFFHWVCWG